MQGFYHFLGSHCLKNWFILLIFDPDIDVRMIKTCLQKEIDNLYIDVHERGNKEEYKRCQIGVYL